MAEHSERLKSEDYNKLRYFYTKIREELEPAWRSEEGKKAVVGLLRHD